MKFYIACEPDTKFTPDELAFQIGCGSWSDTLAGIAQYSCDGEAIWEITVEVRMMQTQEYGKDADNG